MENKKRKCFSCGSEYKYCPVCYKDKDKPTWMFLFDTERCNDVFSSINSYTSNEISKEEVVKILSKHDMSDFSIYTPELQKRLVEVYINDTVKKENIVTKVTKENKKNNSE